MSKLTINVFLRGALIFYCFNGLMANHSELYDFGEAAGDILLADCDICSYNYTLDTPFCLFGEFYDHIILNSKGFLSLIDEVEEPTPSNLGLSNLPVMIVPAWEDNIWLNDTNGTSLSESPGAWIRSTDDQVLLDQAFTDITTGQTFDNQSAFINCLGENFMPQHLIIATWSQACSWCADMEFSCDYDGQLYKKDLDWVERRRSNKRDVDDEVDLSRRSTVTGYNTVQAIVAYDSAHTFVIFKYNSLNWACCGQYNRAGFNPPAGCFSYELPYSGISGFPNMVFGSNVGIPGEYVFRIDNTFVIDENCKIPAYPDRPECYP